MEILSPEQYPEYEAFVRSHPKSAVTQSILWHRVKNNWGHEVVVSRGESGAITGGMSVLIQKVPAIGTTLLYAPRGPVCDPLDRAVFADLKRGLDELANRHNAHAAKLDPDIPAAESAFVALTKEQGFRQTTGGDGFDTIQPRFNYRLYLRGRGEEEVLADLTQKTRYNIRVAQKHGVEVKVAGEEALDDFIRLMRATGERDGFSVRPRSYFERMLRELGEVARLYMAYYQGAAVSGAITTQYGDKTSYIYGASDNDHRNVMPNYLIQWEMIRWAIAGKSTVYDFQGVSGNLSPDHPLYGLYRFKKGFNGTLEELAGEFDFVYRPFRARLVDLAVDTVELWRTLKRKLGK